MAVWFLAGTPLILLMLVVLAGFVGSYQDVTFSDFDTTITGISGLVSYWTLGDSVGATTAVDTQGPNPGTYINLPAGVPYDGTAQSAAVPGTVSPGAGAPLTTNGGITAPDFAGGYVEVPFNAALNPPAFSIVAGVSPDWPGNGASPPSNQPAFRIVIESGQSEGSGVGFLLRSNASDQWEVAVGNGGAARVLVTGPHVTINDATNFLIATFDGSTLALFVDADLAGAATISPAYQPAISSTLRIGSGFQAAAPAPGHAKFPFQGRIESVAIFNRALTTKEIDTLASAFLNAP